MSQLKEILEKERERSTLEQCAAIHLFREGTFYRAYEWSAWLCVRYFTELRFAELCGAHRKETGCVGIGTTPRMVCCTQFLLWLAFALEQLQCQTEVGTLLDIKGMARSTFYYHAKRLHDSDGYDAVRKRIRDIYETNCGRYGYRRVTAQLHNEGMGINHKTVQKLMGQMELKAKTKRQKYRSYKGEVGRVAPNILNRDFSATRPNQKWATDVTQVNIKGDKLYLSPILDMFNGEIVSYTISKTPDLRMATRMLDKAFRARNDLNGLILHSDQG